MYDGGGFGMICFVGVHFGVYIRWCHSDIAYWLFKVLGWLIIIVGNIVLVS